MKSINNFAGLNGFVWWMGVVENRMDPLKLGRCQVRIFGWHTENKQLIPSEDLPWCLPVKPANNSEFEGTPKEGDYVVGFFLDSESGQSPIMLGVLPGIKTENPSGDAGFQDPRTTKEIAAGPQMPAYYTATTPPPVLAAGETTGSPTTVVGQPTSAAIARGTLKGSALQQAYENRAHVCDITAKFKLQIAKVKSFIMKYVKIIREAIAALFVGTSPFPIVQQIKQAISYLKQKIKLLQKELQPIIDEIKAITDYIKTIEEIITIIKEDITGLLKACLASFNEELDSAQKALEPLVTAANVITNAQDIASTAINTATEAISTAATTAVKTKLA
jgi:uncharacterized protein YjgD (DUF1641 family)